MKLSDIDRFSKTFYKSGTFSAKHIVRISRYVDYDDPNNKLIKSKQASNLFLYDINDKKLFITKKGLSIYSDDVITLSNSSDKGGYCTLNQIHFAKLLSMFEKGENWLCDEEYEKLFKIDSEGNTVGVSEEKAAELVKLDFNSWLMIKPAVIFEGNIGIQSIYFKSDRGVIATLKGEEYLSFIAYCRELMNNFYNCSLSLYNSGLLSLFLGGLLFNGTTSKQ